MFWFFVSLSSFVSLLRRLVLASPVSGGSPVLGRPDASAPRSKRRAGRLRICLTLVIIVSYSFMARFLVLIIHPYCAHSFLWFAARNYVEPRLARRIRYIPLRRVSDSKIELLHRVGAGQRTPGFSSRPEGRPGCSRGGVHGRDGRRWRLFAVPVIARLSAVGAKERKRVRNYYFRSLGCVEWLL